MMVGGEEVEAKLGRGGRACGGGPFIGRFVLVFLLKSYKIDL